MKLGTLFKVDPQKKRGREIRKLEKLLYEFSKSDDLTSPIAYDKKFRTSTFWKNTEKTIPLMFNTWLTKKGYKVHTTEEGFVFNSSLFHWTSDTLKFSKYEDYYIAYNFEISILEPKPYKYQVRKLIVKIENTFPKELLVFYSNNQINQTLVTGKYMKEEELLDLNCETINEYLEDSLNVSERVKTRMSIYGLEQHNDILIIARRNAEMHFQEIAENYLSQMAKKGLPLEGIPFQELLDERADYLKKNLIDDYDLDFFMSNRKQLGRTVEAAKRKIINKYLNK